MKKFINKHLVSLVFIVIFVFIFVFGGMYSRYMTNQVEVHREDQIGISLDYYIRNFELNTFIELPYLAHVTYGQNDLETQVYLNSQFQITGLPTGVEITDNILANLQGLINETPPTYETTTYFSGYDDTTNTVTVITQGFHDIIEIDVNFNIVFSSVDSYIVTSSETYIFAQNYINGPVPAVENYYMDGFILGNVSLDSVAGASAGTCPAMQRAVDLLKEFQTYQIVSVVVYNNQNGGN